MQFIKNSLWFIASVISFIVGVVFLIPALIILTISKLLSVLVVTALFSSLMIFAILFRGSNKDSAQHIREIRDMGKSIVTKL